jgi:hypothetical protein
MTRATKIKLGEPVDLHFSTRYFQFNRAYAIHDVFDALVELITNSDDSYHRLFREHRRTEDGGPILVDYIGGKDASITIYDRAEGMTLEQMRERLGDVGTRRSDHGDRGFMARGAKDCTELGNLVYESVRDDRYYKCELTTKPQFMPLSDGDRATKEIRDRLRLKRGNGTAVTLTLDREQRLPRFDTLLRDLPWHVPLRDVLAETSPTQVLLRNLNKADSDAERVVYRAPAGDLLFDEIFEIPGYASKARLKIWKSPEPLEDPSDRFRRSGFIIKGERAVHECTLFYPEFERDVLAKRYFGRVECADIDRLLTEYDERRERQESHPLDNPSLLIDPNRQHGLHPEHPFTKAVFLLPSERLRALVAAERANERSQTREIANRETRSRLDRLAKKASEFLRQQLDELQELSTGEGVDKAAFQHGTMIFPTYVNVAVGEERQLTYYVKSNLLAGRRDQSYSVSVVSDELALKILDPTFEVHPHRSKADRYLGAFRVRGESLKEAIIIRAAYGDLPEAQAIASVVEKKVDEHIFEDPLEFEFAEYRVREGSRRTLVLFAKYPDVVAETMQVNISSTDSAGVPIRGTCLLVPVTGSNYAQGAIVVQGRRLHAKADLRAEVNGRVAVTAVKVVQQPPEAGEPLDIQIRDEAYGNFRAKWADHEGKPNLLLVSARHKSLSRYLGPAPAFEGQDLPLFRVLLAEIVADSVCRKSLALESKERTWEFRWADLKEDHIIADTVFSQFQQRMRDFVTDAHAIMLSDAEVTRAIS